jgi:hypothetical protein
MPGNVIHTDPVDVLPLGLYSAFGEDLRLEALVNDYQDGNSQRAALALNARSYFRLARPLTQAQWQTLRDFYFAHVGQKFYFYAPRETVPPWGGDPTGDDPVGRYTVVFDGPWSEELRLGRSQAGFGLRVVA